MNATGIRRIATQAVICCLALTGFLGCGHSRPVVPPSAPVPVDYTPTSIVTTSGAVALAAPAPTAQPTRQLVRRGRIAVQARLATLRGQVALSELSVALRQRPVLGPLGYVAMGIGYGVRKLFIWR